MRTHIDIDDALIARALRATGLKTKRAAVEEGLRALIRLHNQKSILTLAGRERWTGDLAASREGRTPK